MLDQFTLIPLGGHVTVTAAACCCPMPQALQSQVHAGAMLAHPHIFLCHYSFTDALCCTVAFVLVRQVLSLSHVSIPFFIC